MLTFKTKTKLRLRWCATALALGVASHAGFAQTVQPVEAEPDIKTIAIRQTLQQRYPNTKFGQILRSPMEGVWEVWMGSNVAYVTDDVRYFMFGHLFDMQTQTDITATKKAVGENTTPATATSLGFDDLPLDNAIKTVRGNGARKLAVFTDVDCPYCHQLETTMAKLTDVTIYTFLFPLRSLHPQAFQKSESIWCAADRTTAWQSFLATGNTPTNSKKCKTPIEANLALGARAGIQGTPYIFFANGDRAPGALDLQTLERRLATTK